MPMLDLFTTEETIFHHLNELANLIGLTAQNYIYIYKILLMLLLINDNVQFAA